MNFLNNKHDKQYVAEGIRLLYQQPVNVSIIQLFIATGIILFTFATNSAIHYIWLGVLFAVFVIRMVMIKKFNTVERTDDDALRWGRYYSYTALVTGTAWGCTAFIFTSTYGTGLSVLSAIVALISIGAIISTSLWLQGFYAFIFPALFLYVIKFLFSDEIIWIMNGVGMLLYLLGLFIYGRINNNLTIHSISYKFKHLDVINQLERANNAKSRFFASANHDLRQPMNSLNLIANSLATEPQTARSEALINNLGLTLKRLDHLLDSLLDVSSIDSGSIDFSIQACSLERVFKTILVEHLDECRDKNLELRIRQSNEWVFSDEHSLTRILSNLVNNAVKYTEAGGVLVACRQHSDNHVCIEIWDTGIGINEDQLDHIFEEFYQINNHARNNSDGLGLGLPICKLLAEQLGHKLFVSSRPGKGSVFGLLVEKTEARKKAPQVDNHITHDKDYEGIHVLLVEDDEMGRTVLKDLLSHRGAQVTTAIDLTTAIAACSSPTSNFDLIISDYRLPSPANGIEVIDQIRQKLHNDRLSAILISGDRDPDMSTQSTRGKISFIPKPINIDVLSHEIQTLSN